MIYSQSLITPDQVALHYDELDELYHRVWGEHVHHGWFQTNRESKEEATRRLVDHVASLSGVSKGDTVCDIGCGYGGTANILAKDYGAETLGLTISKNQLARAQSNYQLQNLNFRLVNWLDNDLPNDSFDHLISIESSEHMPDKSLFFSEAHRTLRKNGSFVICAWLAGEKLSSWSHQHLLEPICREGRLPSMASVSEYKKYFNANGFRIQSFQDITASVKRTWTLSIYYLVNHFIHQPRDLRLLLKRWNSNAEFAKSLFRIRLAYELGAMQYGIFKAVKI